jgi:hypothetical protein
VLERADRSILETAEDLIVGFRRAGREKDLTWVFRSDQGRNPLSGQFHGVVGTLTERVNRIWVPKAVPKKRQHFLKNPVVDRSRGSVIEVSRASIRAVMQGHRSFYAFSVGRVSRHEARRAAKSQPG